MLRFSQNIKNCGDCRKKEHRHRWVRPMTTIGHSPRVEMLFRLTYLEDRKYLLQLDKSQID